MATYREHSEQSSLLSHPPSRPSHYDHNEDPHPSLSSSSSSRHHTSNETKTLISAIVLTTLFFIVELTGGYFASSLAIMSDAAHLLSDLTGFVISLIAVSVSRLPANSSLSFGFSRAEVLGAFFSVFFIWALTVILVVFAIIRLFHPTPVNGPLMVLLGLIGLVVNILLTVVLGHSHHGHSHDHSHNHSHSHSHSHSHAHAHVHAHAHSQSNSRTHQNGHDPDHVHNHDQENPVEQIHLDSSSQQRRGTRPPPGNSALLQRMLGSDIESLNVRAAYLHAMGDMLQSIGVIIAAVIITINPRLSFVDPLCTLLFALLVIMTTTGLARDTMTVLMEGTPPSIKLDDVYNHLVALGGVRRVGDLHVWSISPRRPALSVHVYGASDICSHKLLKDIQKMLAADFGIKHATVQINCDEDDCCNEKVYLGTNAQVSNCVSYI